MEHKLNQITLIASTIFLSGCVSGNIKYFEPTTVKVLNNTIIIDNPKESVWNNAIPKLGKQFYVINNLDKSSGLINLSYSGDPEKYIDCGHIQSNVSNLRGDRTYNFPASRANEQYEVTEGINLIQVNRKMELDGRINLIFEEITPNQTKVTANTKYVVNKKTMVQASTGETANFSDSISFNSGAKGSFPTTANGQATECISTGELESEILQALK